MNQNVEHARQLELLTGGHITLLGRILRSSNETFLAQVSDEQGEAWAVYKPLAGERPLVDFPPGLYRRERAAFLLSEHLGWGFVPMTVIRADGPLGEGSLQWFVAGDLRQHYFTLYADAPRTHPALARIAVFDYLANNTDRKSGHVLIGDDGRVWGIDHGLCFAADDKLRTVIWDFAGEAIPADQLGDVASLAEEVPDNVAELLDQDEADALRRRARRLVRERVLPGDPTGMHFPWPLV